MESFGEKQNILKKFLKNIKTKQTSEIQKYRKKPRKKQMNGQLDEVRWYVVNISKVREDNGK